MQADQQGAQDKKVHRAPEARRREPDPLLAAAKGEKAFPKRWFPVRKDKRKKGPRKREDLRQASRGTSTTRLRSAIKKNDKAGRERAPGPGQDREENVQDDFVLKRNLTKSRSTWT